MNFPQEGLVTSQEAIKFLGMSRSSFFALLKRQEEIRRVHIGPRMVRYRADAIRAYVERLSIAK